MPRFLLTLALFAIVSIATASSIPRKAGFISGDGEVNAPMNCSVLGGGNLANKPPIVGEYLEYCSMYNVSSEPKCCTRESSGTIGQNMEGVCWSMFGSKCAQCWKNFVKFWCAFGCEPTQADFVKVTKVEEGVVKALTINMCQQFAQDWYDSCKDIDFGGGHTVKETWPTVDDFFYAQAHDPIQPRPYDMTFKFDAPISESYCELPAYRCQDGCECKMCVAACATPTPSPNPHHGPGGDIFGMPIWAFAVACAGGCGVLALAVFGVVKARKREKEESENSRLINDRNGVSTNIYGSNNQY